MSKWCPFAKIVLGSNEFGDISISKDVSFNKIWHPNESIDKSMVGSVNLNDEQINQIKENLNCIGSDCMLWNGTDCGLKYIPS